MEIYRGWTQASSTHVDYNYKLFRENLIHTRNSDYLLFRVILPPATPFEMEIALDLSNEMGTGVVDGVKVVPRVLLVSYIHTCM